MRPITGAGRRFLFLQGPHGPFFHRLGEMLRASGTEVWRVGFNAGDRAFWFGAPGFIAHDGPLEDWPAHLARIVETREITDFVLYGDTRPVHAEAISMARAAGITVHVFEEGYLRPYWITYERDGSNGNSPLMGMEIASMEAATASDLPAPPARWGDMRQHIFYGALYHWFVMFTNWRFRHFRPHRELSVAQEFRLYLRRLLFMPARMLRRRIATRRVQRGGFPYHVVLLQLDHDSNFRMHSPYRCTTDFLREVTAGFAEGAPPHHHLVIKAHPLESGRVPLAREIRAMARKAGIEARVHYLPGGKLARLLDHASSAVTVNSTAAQQALWRGLPLHASGRAVYGKPGLTSSQALPDFFAAPERPDVEAYRSFRRFLLETSQVPGGFYSARGRQRALRQVVDMMLAPAGPYEMLTADTATHRQQLRLAGGTSQTRA